jgi:hypothetical protein
VTAVSERLGVDIGDRKSPAERVANRFAGQLVGRGQFATSDESPVADRQSPTLGRQRRVVPGLGRPLPEAVRHWAESGTGVSLDDVRIHSDGRAGRLAAAMGARAYTVGRHMVFGRGEYRPDDAGRRLLAHELGHVVQGDVTVRRQPITIPAQDEISQFRIVPSDTHVSLIARLTVPTRVDEVVPRMIDEWIERTFPEGIPAERRNRIVTTAIELAGPERVLEPGNWAIHLPRAPVKSLVEEFDGRTIETADGNGTGSTEVGTESETAIPTTNTDGTEGTVEPTGEVLSPEAHEARLRKVVTDIERLEPNGQSPEQSAERIALRLEGLDLAERETLKRIANAVRSSVPAALPALLQKIEKETGLLSDFAPLLDQSAEDLVAIVSGIENAGAFLEALLTAVGETAPETTKRLAAKLAASSVLGVALSPVFLAGTAVKLAKDIWGMVELPGQVVGFIQNDELRATVMQVAETLFHPDGRELARTFGTEAGRAIVGKLDRMSKLGVVEFTYELGKLLGPMLVKVVVAVLLPVSVAAAAFRRTVGVVRKLLKLLPDLPASVKKLLTRDGADTPKIDGDGPDRSKREQEPEREPEPDAERETDTDATPEPDSAQTPDPNESPSPTPAVSVVKSRRDFDSDEAFEEYLVENHPNVTRDPDGHLFNSHTDRRLKIRDDGRVVNADTNHIATSADPAYVDDDGWVLRPDEELPPHLRRRPPVRLAPSRRATEAQLDRVRESAPDWLTDSEYWPRVRDGLREADVDVLLQAMRTFGDRPGFDSVVSDLVSTENFRTGARFALRYANERLDSTDLVSFERPDRFQYLKQGDEGLESAATTPHRVSDVRVYSEGKRVELKSWGPNWLQSVLTNPKHLRQQFRRDASQVESPDQMRWVFDMSRFRENPQATRNVLDIPPDVELTPELVHGKLVEKLHDALAGDDLLSRGRYRDYLGTFDEAANRQALGLEHPDKDEKSAVLESLSETEPYRQRLEELRRPGKLSEIVEIAGDETP